MLIQFIESTHWKTSAKSNFPSTIRLVHIFHMNMAINSQARNTRRGLAGILVQHVGIARIQRGMEHCKQMYRIFELYLIKVRLYHKVGKSNFHCRLNSILPTIQFICIQPIDCTKWRCVSSKSFAIFTVWHQHLHIGYSYGSRGYTLLMYVYTVNRLKKHRSKRSHVQEIFLPAGTQRYFMHVSRHIQRRHINC